MVDLVAELRASIAAAKQDGDMNGHLMSFARVALGRVDETERYGLTERGIPSRLASDERQALALSLAKTRGRLRSSELAELAGVVRECARLDLAHLVDAGKLEQRGSKKGTYYVLAVA